MNNDELDFHLKSSFEAFGVTVNKIQNRTSLAVMFFAASAFIAFSGLIKEDILIPGIEFKLDSNSAVIVSWAMGIIILSFRALEFIGYRVLKEKLKLLYEERYSIKPALWSYFPPGIVVLMNRFSRLGVSGKIIRILLYFIIYIPLCLSTYKAINTFIYEEPGTPIKIIIITCLILISTSFFTELVTNRKKFNDKFIKALDDVSQ